MQNSSELHTCFASLPTTMWDMGMVGKLRRVRCGYCVQLLAALSACCH
jgi:hypothetical protein